MHFSRRPKPDEVEQLLRNAELRDELERYFDESISRVNVQHWTLAAENDFLASMLAWEQAPILPIYRWFEPELRLPRPDALGEQDLHQILGEVIRKLYAEAHRPGLHRSLERSRLVSFDLPRHPAGAGKEARLSQQLSALGLHGRRRRSGCLAPLLRHGRRAAGMGRELSAAAAAARAAALSARVAPRAWWRLRPSAFPFLSSPLYVPVRVAFSELPISGILECLLT